MRCAMPQSVRFAQTVVLPPSPSRHNIDARTPGILLSDELDAETTNSPGRGKERKNGGCCKRSTQNHHEPPELASPAAAAAACCPAPLEVVGEAARGPSRPDPAAAAGGTLSGARLPFPVAAAVAGASCLLLRPGRRRGRPFPYPYRQDLAHPSSRFFAATWAAAVAAAILALPSPSPEAAAGADRLSRLALCR